MSILEKMFEASQHQGGKVVDPALAVPNVRGGDLETFETVMTGLHTGLANAHQEQHGDGLEVRPVRRADEPKFTTCTVWGDFWKDPEWASKITALKCIEELQRRKRQNVRN